MILKTFHRILRFNNYLQYSTASYNVKPTQRIKTIMNSGCQNLDRSIIKDPNDHQSIIQTINSYQTADHYDIVNQMLITIKIFSKNQQTNMSSLINVIDKLHQKLLKQLKSSNISIDFISFYCISYKKQLVEFIYNEELAIRLLDILNKFLLNKIFQTEIQNIVDIINKDELQITEISIMFSLLNVLPDVTRSKFLKKYYKHLLYLKKQQLYVFLNDATNNENYELTYEMFDSLYMNQTFIQSYTLQQAYMKAKFCEKYEHIIAHRVYFHPKYLRKQILNLNQNRQLQDVNKVIYLFEQQYKYYENKFSETVLTRFRALLIFKINEFSVEKIDAVELISAYNRLYKIYPIDDSMCKKILPKLNGLVKNKKNQEILSTFWLNITSQVKKVYRTHDNLTGLTNGYTDVLVKIIKKMYQLLVKKNVQFIFQLHQLHKYLQNHEINQIQEQIIIYLQKYESKLIFKDPKFYMLKNAINWLYEESFSTNFSPKLTKCFNYYIKNLLDTKPIFSQQQKQQVSIVCYKMFYISHKIENDKKYQQYRQFFSIYIEKDLLKQIHNNPIINIFNEYQLIKLFSACFIPHKKNYIDHHIHEKYIRNKVIINLIQVLQTFELPLFFKILARFQIIQISQDIMTLYLKRMYNFVIYVEVPMKYHLSDQIPESFYIQFLNYVLKNKRYFSNIAKQPLTILQIIYLSTSTFQQSKLTDLLYIFNEPMYLLEQMKKHLQGFQFTFKKNSLNQKEYLKNFHMYNKQIQEQCKIGNNNNLQRKLLTLNQLKSLDIIPKIQKMHAFKMPQNYKIFMQTKSLKKFPFHIIPQPHESQQLSLKIYICMKLYDKISQFYEFNLYNESYKLIQNIPERKLLNFDTEKKFIKQKIFEEQYNNINDVRLDPEEQIIEPLFIIQTYKNYKSQKFFQEKFDAIVNEESNVQCKYSNILKAFIGNIDKLQLVFKHERFQPSVAYIIRKLGYNYKENGALLQIQYDHEDQNKTIGIICYNDSNYKLLSLAAYILNENLNFMPMVDKTCSEAILKRYIESQIQKLQSEQL